MADAHKDKKAKAEDAYELHYWPGIPGRGEPIRLALEEAGAKYTDVYNESKEGAGGLMKLMGDDFKDSENLPCLAPPILRHGELVIGQSPNILLYLGPRLGLAGKRDNDLYRVNQLTLTAFDLQNEAHDTHHPIATMDYYEDQKQEAKKKAADFCKNRIPKFLGYFERVLKSNGENSYLVGDSLTYADLALFHVVHGISFAFPKHTEKALGEYKALKAHFDSTQERPRIKAYFESSRRQKYSHGIFRYYAELQE